MDPELRLLDLVRRDWWILVIVLCIIWAIECHLEGNSVIETIEAPLLVVAWGGLILLIDRWALRQELAAADDPASAHREKAELIPGLTDALRGYWLVLW
jgi:hypothetical protein